MANILEITNWNQLVDARADNKNLRILVSNINSSSLIGTKIVIADITNSFIYFCGFVDIISGESIPVSSQFTPDEMMEKLNDYGFNISIVDTHKIDNSVVTILSGLFAAGYRYVYRDYPKGATYMPYELYATQDLKQRMSDLQLKTMPDFIESFWQWVRPNTMYSINLILSNNGYVSQSNPI